ncbi:MAG TPA: glycoside hydrolase family 13 protein [Propionibacteriaceae bacterium]|nr:glycoside hydrolase family 13 protein [Propionibacteriaceae bacterium]
MIYQIYPRSFADSNADGIGDLAGITERLDALSALGVDAVWLSPFYRSPQADAGYDVADYCDVDPMFGTLADFDSLVARAHALDLRVIVDLVPNHTSTAHPWFQAALAAGPGSPERARYLFADEPNDWLSVFGGSAWTQVADGQWYLHLYDASQPDLNWQSADVRALFEHVLRFWLDRDVDGFRVDVAHGLVKDLSFRSFPDDPLCPHAKLAAPYWDQDGVHEIYRSWRAIVDSYAAHDPSRPRILCAEANVPVARAVRYVRSDEMHQAFNFAYLHTPWSAPALRRVIEESLEEYGAVGAPATWVLSNHDVVRHASRLGFPDSRPTGGIGADDPQPDRELGLRRARAATMVMLALPGSAYLYQGEELGLPESTQMPDEFRQDPNWVRKNYTEKGRDGARVPLPWVSTAMAFGFGGMGATWLPQPADYADYARDLQEASETSTLQLYKTALAWRRKLGLASGDLVWESEPGSKVLRFRRRGVQVVCNVSGAPYELPAGAEVLVASAGDLEGRHPSVGHDECVWLRVS